MIENKVIQNRYSDQIPGTSGLRKKVNIFLQPDYLETYVQAIFNALGNCEGKALVIGGDGRYFNSVAIQTVIRMAVGNKFKKVYVAKDGLLSTPSGSFAICDFEADLGILLTASHNPGGVDGDFGIKCNGSNGAPGSDRFMKKVTNSISKLETYLIHRHKEIRLNNCVSKTLCETEIVIFDSIQLYNKLIKKTFDLSTVSKILSDPDYRFVFDCMNAVNGPYARSILFDVLGSTSSTIIHGVPLPDFGGKHPDPSPTHAKELTTKMIGPSAASFGCATDGDGDRNMVYGANQYINPCDSLAIIVEHSSLFKQFHGRELNGVARSMPTSRALDRVAKSINVPCYETPTGWKYFGDLLEKGLIDICGEEAFGTGASHVREKDGIWAILCWLTIQSVTNKTPKEILWQHWETFGRDFFLRHDYENLSVEKCRSLYAKISDQIDFVAPDLRSNFGLLNVENLVYRDPINDTLLTDLGFRLFFKEDAIVTVRTSGTSTQRATLRIYFERYSTDRLELFSDPQCALRSLVDQMERIFDMSTLLGRDKPDTVC